jgi:sugar O-acyltransferase (sialic acid O-acetyltransferase NeuD family)
MEGVVIYGVGSPILVDVEESLLRAGIRIVAGVQNRAGASFLSDKALLCTPDVIADEIKALPFLAPLFTPGNRQVAVNQAGQLGLQRPFSLIDPSVAVARAFRFGPGLYVNAGCSLGAASDFGSFVFINRGASVGHHARLGSFVSIGPGAVIAGSVTIGKGSMVGAGAVVLPEITIGENAVVGAGAVVTRDVPDHCLALGNPARVVKTGISGYNGVTVV